MNQWLAQTQFIQNISEQLLKPRREHYSQDSFILRMQDRPQLYMRHLHTINNLQEKLYMVLVDHRNKKSDTCIIYLHGLGSNILEGSVLIDYLPSQVALCCFDFSGSGKSWGNYCAYGSKEYKDIGFIMDCLEVHRYKKFILWGRSMGAFASFAHTSKVASQHQCILQILDSPFSNFEGICEQRARHHFKFPEILVTYAVGLLKKNMSQHPFNPFQINLIESAKNCQVPTIFVYSENDEIIPCQNTEDLIQQLDQKCTYERLIIPNGHNCNRSSSTLRLLMDKVKKALLFDSQCPKQVKKQAINVCSSYLKKYGSNRKISNDSGRKKVTLLCSMHKPERQSPRKKSNKGHMKYKRADQFF